MLLSSQLDKNKTLKDAFEEILREGQTARRQAQLLEMMGLCKVWKPSDEFKETLGLASFSKIWRGEERSIMVQTEPTCKLYREHFRVT